MTVLHNIHVKKELTVLTCGQFLSADYKKTPSDKKWLDNKPNNQSWHLQG